MKKTKYTGVAHINIDSYEEREKVAKEILRIFGKSWEDMSDGFKNVLKNSKRIGIDNGILFSSSEEEWPPSSYSIECDKIGVFLGYAKQTEK